MEVYSQEQQQRKQSTYFSFDENFAIQKEVYRDQQYSQIFFARLHMMRTLLYSLVPKWKSHLSVCTVLGLEEGKECIIVGTLYKHMKLKPCILDEYSKERSVAPLETSAGAFFVEDVLEAGLPPQIERPLKSREDKYVVFVSGLSIGKSSSNPLQFQLLVDHITGHLGDEEEQGRAAKIVHLVIAGNSVEVSRRLLNGQNLASKDQSRWSEPFKELDIQLTQIAANLPLDIMPGSSDPANFFLPQQSLNRCLFPGSATYNTFRSCTNPHCFELDNIRFLGTSGCYPFTDRDPFLIDSCPDVYFVGNQKKYETRLVKGLEGQSVRLICIPRFCETGLAVVINMRNLECHALTFGTQFR
ncbi:hypothetical protein V6N11_027753 [Hibiscus sabdariffa]|uniref:DNA polymerase delta small subunit n=1 Tax=Hibiscus sabdariffa TaxID=183260 RepID=A0ABR2NUD1_9ROSI